MSFVFVGTLFGIAAIGLKLWVALPVVVVVEVCGILIWATCSRVAAVLALIVACLVVVLAALVVYVQPSVGSFMLASLLLAAMLPFSAARGIQGAWSWERLNRRRSEQHRAV